MSVIAKAVVLTFLVLSVSANGAIYNFEITDGLLQTSGGFDGSGFGTFSLSGSFSLEVNGDEVQFSNSIVTADRLPPDSNYTFLLDMPSYTGVIAGQNLSGEEQLYPSFLPVEFSGTFDGVNMSLAVFDHDFSYDGYRYNYNIQATVVPLPGTMLLLAGGAFIARKRKIL